MCFFNIQECLYYSKLTFKTKFLLFDTNLRLTFFIIVTVIVVVIIIIIIIIIIITINNNDNNNKILLKLLSNYDDLSYLSIIELLSLI